MRTLRIEAFVPDTDAGRALPAYPKLGATVVRLRKLPPTPENLSALADAIGEAVRANQRREFEASLRQPGDDKCPCVSGTWSSDPKVIERAVRARIKGQMSRALEADHAAREDWQVGQVLAATLAGHEVRGLVIHQQKGQSYAP